MTFLPASLVDLLCDQGVVVSKSEARRLIGTGRVQVDGTPVEDIAFLVEGEVEVKVGSKSPFKVTSKPSPTE